MIPQMIAKIDLEDEQKDRAIARRFRGSPIFLEEFSPTPEQFVG
jgi:hypothetical protein